MNAPLIPIAAAAVGILIGVGGTLVYAPSSLSPTTNTTPAPSQEQITAAIAGNPALCATVAVGNAIVAPSEDEAVAAFRRAKGSNEATLRLGQCASNSMGPGVQCVVKFKLKARYQEQEGTVGFAKGPDGWQATHYY